MHFKIFPSLIEKPENIKFENQENDEKIELFLRAHWIENSSWIITAILLTILPLILVQLDLQFNLNLLSTIPPQLIFGGLIIYFMLVIAFVIENFLFWYFNADIVTNKHIVDINFYSLLSREITEVGLEDVEIVSRQSGGILDSLFNFGDVIIETAAEQKNIRMDNISNPDFVVDKIQDLREARKLFFEGDSQ